MDAPVFSMGGEELRREELPDDVFGIEPNGAVMHQALTRQLANARQGSHHSRTRSEVIRTGSKWYRQKGTGRARHGDRGAGIFVGGGVIHGPKPRSYRKSMPRRMRRLALRSALSAKAADDAIVLVDELAMDAPRTRHMEELIDRICDGRTTLVLLADRNDEIERSIDNLPHVRHLRAAYLNVRDLLGFERLLMDTAGLAEIIDHLGRDGRSHDDGQIGEEVESA